MTAHRIGRTTTASEGRHARVLAARFPTDMSYPVCREPPPPTSASLGRRAPAPRAEGHGTLPSALGNGVVGKAWLRREAAIDNADARIRIVHLDKRPGHWPLAATPQAIRVRSLNIIRAQVAGAYIVFGGYIKSVEEGRELCVGRLVDADQERIERNTVRRSGAR